MSTALIIGGVVLGVAVLAGVSMMGKKREPTEDTFYGAENTSSEYSQDEYQGGKRSRRRKRVGGIGAVGGCSRRSRRVKI